MNDVLAAALLIFGDLFLLEQFLEHAETVSTGVAHGYASGLRFSAGLLDVALAGLLGQHRHRNADHIARRCRVQSQIRLENSALDIRRNRLVECHHTQRSGVFNVDVGQLVKRRFGAVILDPDTVQQTRVCPARANFVEVVGERLKGLTHPFFGVLLDVVDHDES